MHVVSCLSVKTMVKNGGPKK